MKKSVIFIIAAVFVVLGVYVVRYLDSPVETSVAHLTEYEEKVDASAYFIREESVYNAGASGTFYTYADEGARVGKDRLIATVYNGVVDSRVLEEINNLDQKIEELSDYSKNNSFSAGNLNSENRLANLKGSIIEAAQNNDPSDITNIKNEIKSIISGEEIGDTDAEIEALENEKQIAEDSLGTSKTDIYSDCSGVFSTNIDALEGVLTVDRIEEYTLADFESLSQTELPETGVTAAISGEPVCKVIDNHAWYVMAKLPAEKLLEYEEDQQVTLRIEKTPGAEAKARLIHTSLEEGAAEGVAIFECEQYIEGIFSVRQSNIEIISEQYSGFEIPIYALRVQDGQQGVMVQYGVNEIFKPCTVVYTDNENDIVIIEPVTEGVNNPLEQYDKIIIGEKAEEKASDGQ